MRVRGQTVSEKVVCGGEEGSLRQSHGSNMVKDLAGDVCDESTDGRTYYSCRRPRRPLKSFTFLCPSPLRIKVEGFETKGLLRGGSVRRGDLRVGGLELEWGRVYSVFSKLSCRFQWSHTSSLTLR